MKLLKTVVIAASIAGLSLGAASAAADGAALYVAKGCVGCHGAGGKSVVPMFPKLAGQHAAYCQKQIADIKAGTRANAPMMVGAIASINAAEATEICTYIAGE